MSDGSIEEDFEKVFAKEISTTGDLGSPETPLVNAKPFDGKYAS